MQERNRGILVEPVYELPEPNDGPRVMVDDQPTQEKQTKQEMLRDYEISFNFMHSGCVVRIGCKSIAFTTTKEAVVAFNEYVNDPEVARKKWFKKFEEE